MISGNFDAEEFFQEVVDYDYDRLGYTADRECAAAEALSFRRRGGPRAREQGSVEYARILKGFLFFLQNGVRPGGLSWAEFVLFRPVIARLVEKGQFKPEALQPFGEPS